MNRAREELRSYPLIMRRWLDLILLLIISTLFFVIIHPIIIKLDSLLGKWFPSSEFFSGGSPAILILLFLTSTYIWLFLIRAGGFRYRNLFPNRIFKSFRMGILYPPTWIFGFIGAILSYYLNSLLWKTDPFDWSVIMLSIASFLPGIFAASLVDNLCTVRKSNLIKSEQSVLSDMPAKIFSALLLDEDAFTNWLNKEMPIRSLDEDLFGLAIFAKRIATMFQQTPLKTIAIVGSYGCGKSSVINMIGESLRRTNINSAELDKNGFGTDRIITCKVQGWGLYKNTVAEHILRSVLAELSKFIDCLGLFNIPAAYRDALSNGSSWLKAFLAMSSEAREPVEILRKLDSVLACNQKRMVLFLEDLDRNITGAAYWKELTSLLDRLRDLDNITFVLAINQNSKAHDILIRICEHIEFVPALSRLEVLDCLKFFRNLCLNRFLDTDIDCRTREERDKHIGLMESVRSDIAAMLDLETRNPINVIAKITNNPRALKSSLRHTWHSWQALHGEVDFDDLLVAKVIYTVAPEAFAFMNEYAQKMRSLDIRSSDEYSSKRSEEISKKIETAWHDINGSWNSDLMKVLINFLFPEQIKNDFYRANVPQGVINSSPNDYWIRLNKGELSRGEIPDQVILHGIQYWKTNPNNIVYQGYTLSEAILQIEGFAATFEHFGNSLNGHEILSLAGEVLELIRKENVSLPKGAQYFGFIELWRLSLDQPVPEHDTWLLAEIRKTVPISLRLANELYYYWRNQDHFMVSSKDKTPALRDGFIEAARQTYENNGQALVDAIMPEYIYDIHHLMIYYSEPDGGGPGFNPAEWKWLTKVLLAAGKINPQVIIPQLACLLTNEASTLKKGFAYSFNEERFNALFGEDKSVTVELLATRIDTASYDERDRNRIEYIHQEAAGRIKHLSGLDMERQKGGR